MSNDKWYSGVSHSSSSFIWYESIRWPKWPAVWKAFYVCKKSRKSCDTITLEGRLAHEWKLEKNENHFSAFHLWHEYLSRLFRMLPKSQAWSLSEVKSVCPFCLSHSFRLSDFHNIVSWIYEHRTEVDRSDGSKWMIKELLRKELFKKPLEKKYSNKKIHIHQKFMSWKRKCELFAMLFGSAVRIKKLSFISKLKQFPSP